MLGNAKPNAELYRNCITALHGSPYGRRLVKIQVMVAEMLFSTACEKKRLLAIRRTDLENYTDINAKAIDKWVEKGWEWSIPVTHEPR